MSILPACMHMHNVSVWCPQRSEESIRSSRTGVKDGSETPHGRWELNLDPPESNKSSSSLSHHSNP